MNFLSKLHDWQKIAIAIVFFGSMGGALAIKAQEYVTHAELAQDRIAAGKLRDKIDRAIETSAILSERIGSIQTSNQAIREDLKTLLQVVLENPPGRKRR